MPFLSPNQQRQSTEGRALASNTATNIVKSIIDDYFDYCQKALQIFVQSIETQKSTHDTMAIDTNTEIWLAYRWLAAHFSRIHFPLT